MLIHSLCTVRRTTGFGTGAASVLILHKNAMKHYWSITLDELKGNSLSRYRIWVAAGKPKQGTIFHDMKDAKYKYKLAVRDAVRSYESRFSDDLFDHLLSKDMQGCWEVWAHKTCVTSVDSIDGKTGDLEIANAFKDSLNVCSNRKDSIDVDFI